MVKKEYRIEIVNEKTGKQEFFARIMARNQEAALKMAHELAVISRKEKVQEN